MQPTDLLRPLTTAQRKEIIDFGVQSGVNRRRMKRIVQGEQSYWDKLWNRMRGRDMPWINYEAESAEHVLRRVNRRLNHIENRGQSLDNMYLGGLVGMGSLSVAGLCTAGYYISDWLQNVPPKPIADLWNLRVAASAAVSVIGLIGTVGSAILYFGSTSRDKEGLEKLKSALTQGSILK